MIHPGKAGHTVVTAERSPRRVAAIARASVAGRGYGNAADLPIYPFMPRLRSTLRRRDVRIMLAVVALALVAVAAIPGAWHMLTALVGGDRESVRAALLGLGPLAPIASVVLNVVQAILAPVPGFVIPYINGIVFGTTWGAMLSWVGGVAAAAACFGLSRTVGRGFAERMCRGHATLDHANQVLERHGLGAVILARLLPGMPFDAFSYLGGLTRVRFVPFILGTAIGSAPHAYAYALMGEHLDIPVWLGVVLTSLVGVVVAGAHWCVRALRRRRRDLIAVGVVPAWSEL